MTTSSKPAVTAVGRLLQPKQGEYHVYKVISISDEGMVKTVIKESITSNTQGNRLAASCATKPADSLLQRSQA